MKIRILRPVHHFIKWSKSNAQELIEFLEFSKNNGNTQPCLRRWYNKTCRIIFCHMGQSNNKKLGRYSFKSKTVVVIDNKHLDAQEFMRWVVFFATDDEFEELCEKITEELNG